MSPHPSLPLRKFSFCSENPSVRPGPTLEQSAVALAALQPLGFRPLLPGVPLVLVLINLIPEAPGFHGRRAAGCMSFGERGVWELRNTYLLGSHFTGCWEPYGETRLSEMVFGLVPAQSAHKQLLLGSCGWRREHSQPLSSNCLLQHRAGVGSRVRAGVSARGDVN